MDLYLDPLPTLDVELPASLRAVMVCPSSADAQARDTLAKIVAACGLTEARDCLTVFLDGPAALPPVAGGGSGTSAGRGAGAGQPGVAQSVVVFGIQPQSVGIVAETARYRWTPVLGGRSYCFAERLSLIGQDQARKKRLWEAVKSLKA